MKSIMSIMTRKNSSRNLENKRDKLPNGIKLIQITETYCNKFSLDQIERFIHLIENNDVIQQFLAFDRCFMYADKYLLAMVFVYFIRAKLTPSEYDRLNFFCALYLAHDIEEDDESLKEQVMKWGLGRSLEGQERQFLKLRDQLWKRMNYRAMINIQCCHEKALVAKVMNSKPDLPLWQRERSLAHVSKEYYLWSCPNCTLVEEERFYDSDLVYEISSSSESSESDSDTPPRKKCRIEE